MSARITEERLAELRLVLSDGADIGGERDLLSEMDALRAELAYWKDLAEALDPVACRVEAAEADYDRTRHERNDARAAARTAEARVVKMREALEECETAMADAGLRVGDFVWRPEDRSKLAAWEMTIERQSNAARLALAALKEES